MLRDGQRLRRPLGQRRLETGDVLLVRAAPEQIMSVRKEPGVQLHPVEQYRASTTATAEREDEEIDRLVQAVVAPGSELVGRTISGVDFRRRYGVIVLSLWWQHAWLEEELAQTRLRAADVLVLQGDDEALGRVAADPGFLMMVPFHGEAHSRRKGPLAGLIMVGTILLAVFDLVPLEIAGLAGAITLVLSRCLTAGQAYRAIDARIYVFIAGAIPLGVAMEQSGSAKLLGGWLQAAVEGWSQTLILLALFGLVAIVTQFMSDSATTALFAPVAIALAQALGQAPEPYVVTVAMASVVSFLTPIGHHGNLLIYGPGGYRFSDFVRVGTPLTILAALVVVLLAPLIWRG